MQIINTSAATKTRVYPKCHMIRTQGPTEFKIFILITFFSADAVGKDTPLCLTSSVH